MFSGFDLTRDDTRHTAPQTAASGKPLSAAAALVPSPQRQRLQNLPGPYQSPPV
jgi:hypothetical protein